MFTITDTTVDLWSKKSLGALDTSGHVGMFGFSDKLYIQDGLAYRYWDGTTYGTVTGYRPLVSIAVPPAGGGTTLEQINALNGLRRVWFSPNGATGTFQLPETSLSSIDYVKIVATGAYYDIVETADEADECTVSTANGTVTFHTAPSAGTNTIEIGYTAATDNSETVTAMRYSETFSGATDAYVFLYGDGTNTAIYSGIDYDGLPNAEYFPVLHTMAIGDENTPITSLLRHYNMLMAYKEDSAYGIRYDYITLTDGVMTPAFAIQPVNRGIGNKAMGQAVLAENFPRTLDGNSIYEWRTVAGGTITNDQRNAQRVSQRVERTLALMDLENAVAYFDKINHEYYVTDGDNCVVHNTENDTWYVYSDFAATCIVVYQDEVYYGTADGYLRHFSHDYLFDNSAAINAYWHSGSMDFGSPTKRKASARMWVALKPETGSSLTVEVDTDNSTTIATKTATAATTGDLPDINRLKLKAKKFVYYKLKLSSNSATTTATVDSVSIRVNYTADAK